MEAGEEDFNWLLYVLMTFLGFWFRASKFPNMIRCTLFSHPGKFVLDSVVVSKNVSKFWNTLWLTHNSNTYIP